jgi:hypothetical protein
MISSNILFMSLIFLIILFIFMFLFKSNNCDSCKSINNEERWYCFEGKCQQDINKKYTGKTYKNKSDCETKTKSCNI